MAARTIQSVCNAAGLASRGGYETRPALNALFAHLRAATEKWDAEKSDSVRRKQKAEADEAELRAMEAAKQTVTLADAREFWSDARIEIRKTVERAPYLTPVQKTRLLTAFAALSPKMRR